MPKKNIENVQRERVLRKKKIKCGIKDTQEKFEGKAKQPSTK